MKYFFRWTFQNKLCKTYKMQTGIGFQEQDFRNKLFRTSFLEQASHQLSSVYTLSYCFLSKRLQQQWERRCSDNGDECGGSVAAMIWFNDERYFNIFAFSMRVKLNSNFYKILNNMNTQTQQRLCFCYNNKNHYQSILTTTIIFVFIKIYALIRLLLVLQYVYTITYTFNVS